MQGRHFEKTSIDDPKARDTSDPTRSGHWQPGRHGHGDGRPPGAVALDSLHTSQHPESLDSLYNTPERCKSHLSRLDAGTAGLMSNHAQWEHVSDDPEVKNFKRANRERTER